MITHPLTRDLVLIGGGHTHALVLRAWGMAPLPGARLTLINPGPTAPYSGMLPGHLAGHYDRAALDIDLVRLARFAGARLVLGSATGIDLTRGEIAVDGHPPIGFDVASVDVGITSDMPALPGFADHAIPAKPLGPFASRWADWRAGKGPAAAAVIGGGVAGAEIAMAMAHALRARGRATQVTLVERDRVLATLPVRSARRLRAALQRAGVTVAEQAEIREITAQGLILQDGRLIEAGFVTGAAGARPWPWLAGTGLATQDGFVIVDDRLRSSDPRVFAAGDCAHMAHAPRPKAGVYAVRQAPVLAANLRATLAGTGGLRRYRPQADYLKLISLGERDALANRHGLTLSGPWLWRLKDRIDRRFMDQFRDLPRMAQPAPPWPRATGLVQATGGKPLCGGCGAKLGAPALVSALRDLPAPRRDDVIALPGDDAGLLQMGGTRQVISTDHLRAFWDDPAVMARIAAQHALGDIWAMGAAPQAALAQIILPRMAPHMATRTTHEIMQAASDIFAQAGAAIVGGHSTLGAELTIGFTVTGLAPDRPVTLSGARPGDALILTAPLGTGVIFAAEMAGTAQGADVAAALHHMAGGQGLAAAALARAHAMTDVTGFGLAGHLANICRASGTGAEIWLDAIPLLPGAATYARRGIRSSLWAENRAGVPEMDMRPDHPTSDLLFDPQTAGGLLAAVADGDAVLCDLHARGVRAGRIGTITQGAAITLHAS